MKSMQGKGVFWFVYTIFGSGDHLVGVSGQGCWVTGLGLSGPRVGYGLVGCGLWWRGLWAAAYVG